MYMQNLSLEIKNYTVEFFTSKEGNILIKNAREQANKLQD